MLIRDNFTSLNINAVNYAMEDSTYVAYYWYWMDELFERTMRLFEEKTDPVPPEEIEMRLVIQGHCGIANMPKRFKEKGGLTAFFGNPNGVGKYITRLPYYCVHSPVWSKNLKVDDQVIVIYNNVIHNPLLDLVHHYAQILAHTDVTYIHAAVDLRDAQGSFVAQNNPQKESISAYLRAKFNGKFSHITDMGGMGVDVIGQNNTTKASLYDLWNTRERIISSFMSCLGVKSALDKNSNTVVDEVNAEVPALLINLDDMLKCRKEGFEKVNDLFGTSWTVKLNPNLEYINNYTKENGNEDNRQGSLAEGQRE